MPWNRISNNNVRHIWHSPHDKNKTQEIPPDFYHDAGIPCDDESGDDLVYSHTEVLSDTEHGQRTEATIIVGRINFINACVNVGKRSCWFAVMPLPDDAWRFTFKAGEGHCDAINPS